MDQHKQHKAKSYARAPGQTSVTISLPVSLKSDITQLADEDSRTRSNWIVHELTGLVEQKKAEKASKLLRVAEDPETLVIDRRALEATRKKQRTPRRSIYGRKKKNNPVPEKSNQ